MPVKLNLDDFKKEISLTKKKEENLVDLKDFEYISYTNNHEVDDFLNEKSFMLINFIGKSNIFLGNIFLEVQNYLNENSIEETTYCNWLERNGFNRMTALRYKKRAEIYSSLSSENSKKIIALLNQKTIEEIYKFNDRQAILTYLEKINDVSEIESYLRNTLILKKEESEVEIIEVDSLDLENRVRKLSTSIENLEPKKQKQVDSLLKKIEKIMNS
ncbi:hypothetical protein [Fusobacterium gastrosuis]|uniref:hypothetical protein n=2 Tax=Fusobacterium TaxID=848 RepID=UPI0029720967|nr:hypothetical protein [Fusobacteriaceae bacterium]MDY2573802.1 hypothetical protein [Fusobacterium necrophorum]MDY5713607.1 hypothetical protein [Fusobacterium gastrosuis]